MNNILSITEEAKSQIKKILSNAPSQIDSILVGVDKSGCSGYAYKIEYAKSTEILEYDCINNDGFKLFIDPKATMFLIGSVMNYKKDKLSSRFVFKNPNEKNTCGCGESFSI